MKYEELPRVDWEPQIYMSFDPETHKYLGKEVYWKTTKSVPENLIDVIELCAQKGITFKNTKFYNHDIECIPCIEESTGREGYYDPYDKVFKTTEEMLLSFDIHNTQFSIK